MTPARLSIADTQTSTRGSPFPYGHAPRHSETRRSARDCRQRSEPLPVPKPKIQLLQARARAKPQEFEGGCVAARLHRGGTALGWQEQETCKHDRAQRRRPCA